MRTTEESLWRRSESHGGTGMAFVSTTRPGQLRGDHYHLRKIERFFVVAGEAEIALRRLYHDDVITFRVSGDNPGFVDMPTMWVHNIRNVGTNGSSNRLLGRSTLGLERARSIPRASCTGGPAAMKVMTIVGTRPEIIRLSRVIVLLDETVEHVLVHTGQNYDHTLNQVFFEDLDLARARPLPRCRHLIAGACPRRRPHQDRGSVTHRAAGRRSGPGRHQLVRQLDHRKANEDSRLPHGSRQSLLRRERPRGNQPASCRPRRGLQPLLHRARAPKPAFRGAASAANPPHRLTDARGPRALPRRDWGVRRGRTARA